MDKFILNDIARDTWGFYGYVFSDAGSMGEVISQVSELPYEIITVNNLL